MINRIAIASIVFLSAMMAGQRSLADEMTFRLIPGNHTTFIVADGEITSETPEAFQKFLEGAVLDGFNFEVHLNSSGGNLFGGIRLGAMIRDENFSTHVSRYGGASGDRRFAGECYSACAYAFLGGKNRDVGEAFDGTKSIIGFHQFRSSKEPQDFTLSMQEMLNRRESTTQIIVSVLFEYILEMGVDPRLFTLINRTPPDQLYIPTAEERRTLRIDTRTGYFDFAFEPYKNGVIAYARSAGGSSGRERVNQVTAYCRNGQPYLLLSSYPESRGFSVADVEYFKQSKPGFEIRTPERTVLVDAEDINYRTGGEQLFEITIPASVVPIIENASEIFGYLKTPAVGGSFSFRIYPSSADARKILSAFDLCIS